MIGNYFKQYQAIWVGIMLAQAVTSAGAKGQPTMQQPSPNLTTVASPSGSSSFQRTLAQSVPDDYTSEQQKAAQVIRHYYDAINRKDYKSAYADWAANGAASNQSFEQFKRGFANTASVKVEIGKLGDLDGAVGHLYIEIRVTITAKTVNGETQKFTGSYTLKRTNDVPGSTPEQRKWHLNSAKITRVN